MATKETAAAEVQVKLNEKQEIVELFVGNESATFVSSEQVDNPEGTLRIASTTSTTGFCCSWQRKNGQLVYTCVPC